MRSTFDSRLSRRAFLRASAFAGAGLTLPGRWLLGCGSDDGGTAAVPLEVDPSLPWWLQNNFEPVFEEITETDLEVRGSIPSSLDGLYVRNGSNPQAANNTHWFFGDGMLHGVRIRDGRALWYRNRYIRTPLYEGGLTAVEGGAPLGGNNQSNVSAIYHAGKVLTSGEVGLPYEIDPSDLSTVGAYDFAGELSTSFTAHPKIDPATGHLHFFGYFFAEPYVTYHVADASGALIHSEVVPGRGPTMMHSFAITDRDAIFWELPVLFDGQFEPSGWPFSWDESFGARIGVMPLGGRAADLRWVEIDPCYVFHELNAFREGDDVVVDVCRYDRMMAGERFGTVNPRLTRWRIGTGGEALTFSDQQLDDTLWEFPFHDRRFTGRPNRYGWLTTVREHPDTIDLAGVASRDQQTGEVRIWDPGPNSHAGEAFFVPDGDGEGEGWLMTFVYDHARDTTDLVILDALAVERGPVAEIRMPSRVPYGFHGLWVPA
jgi:carotenoid cleavage dioxygenase-like enzyme